MDITYLNNNQAYCLAGGWKIYIKKIHGEQINLYDTCNSFDITFHSDDVDTLIFVLEGIKSGDLISDVVQDYRRYFQGYLDSNHVDRHRIGYIIELLSNYLMTIDSLIKEDNIEDILNKSSLNRLVAIHDKVEKQRKEKPKCLDQSLKDLVS